MPQENSTETTPAAPRRPGRPKSIPGQPKTTVQRRQRRTVATNAVTLAKTIIDSMLASGSASQKDTEIVLTWARNVGNEADALKELVKRPRRAKSAGASERIAKLELNKALLQGLVAGQFVLSVDADGDIVFAKK
jgi:hypothetical protein